MQNTQPSIETTKPKKPRRLKKALLIIAAIIITPILLHYAGVEYSKWKMQTYLQDKYKKEFVVKNYRIEGAGLGVEGDPTADAYPKDNPDIKFKVWDYGRPVVGPHSYDDGYLSVAWKREYIQRVRDRVVDIVGEGVKYDLSISYNRSLLLEIDFSRGVPKFSQYKDSPGTAIDLSIYGDREFTAQEVWDLLAIFKQDKIPEISFHTCTKNRRGCYSLSEEDVNRLTDVQQLEVHIGKVRRY